MAKVTLDYSKTEKFIRQDEVKAFARIAEAAKEVLVSRTGEGNDIDGEITVSDHIHQSLHICAADIISHKIDFRRLADLSGNIIIKSVS